jgi:hypothetical protein
VTDDFRSTERDSDFTIVAAASRLARQISKVLNTGRGSRAFDEAERAAILSEAFQCAASGGPHDAD